MDLAEGHNAVFYLVNIQIIHTAYKFFTMINKLYSTIKKNYTQRCTCKHLSSCILSFLFFPLYLIFIF